MPFSGADIFFCADLGVQGQLDPATLNNYIWHVERTADLDRALAGTKLGEIASRNERISDQLMNEMKDSCQPDVELQSDIYSEGEAPSPMDLEIHLEIREHAFPEIRVGLQEVWAGNSNDANGGVDTVRFEHPHKVLDTAVYEQFDTR